MKLIKKLLTHCFSGQNLILRQAQEIKFWLFLVRVSGESAWPVLIPGNIYIAASFLKPREGDFVVFQNPGDKDKVLVKRVERIKGDAFYVRGTVSWASSSEDFGLAPWDLILGRILLPRHSWISVYS